MKKTILLLLFTATSFAQNATWNGTKTIGTTFKMIGILDASGGEKTLVLDGAGKPKLAIFAVKTTNFNAAVGVGALQNVGFLGRYNVANGYNSLFSNTTGSYNVANGYKSLFFNTTGSYNIAIGNSSLAANTIGENNLAIGNSSLAANTTGESNLAIGSDSMGQNTEGTYNIAIGSSVLTYNTTGNNNIAIGFQAGSNASFPNNPITTGSNNTIIGVQNTGNVSDCVFIGNGAGTSRLEVNANGIIRFVTSPPIYADESTATANGLTSGQIYKTADGTLKIVN